MVSKVGSSDQVDIAEDIWEGWYMGTILSCGLEEHLYDHRHQAAGAVLTKVLKSWEIIVTWIWNKSSGSYFCSPYHLLVPPIVFNYTHPTTTAVIIKSVSKHQYTEDPVKMGCLVCSPPWINSFRIHDNEMFKISINPWIIWFFEWFAFSIN